MSVFFIVIPVPSVPEPATETPAADETGLLMDAVKAAEWLGISVDTFSRVGFPFTQLTPNGRRFYRKDEILKHLESATIHPQLEIKRKANRISKDLINGAVNRAFRNAQRKRKTEVS